MLGFLMVWSSRTTTSKGVQEEEGLEIVVPVASGTESNDQEVENTTASAPGGEEAKGVETEVPVPVHDGDVPVEDEQTHMDPTPTLPPVQQKRFSFRPVALFNGRRPNAQKTIITEEQEEHEREKVIDAGKRATLGNGSRNIRKLRADKEVKKSALALQQMIVGTGKDGISPVGGTKSKPVTRTELKKIKSQLMSPKTANRVIAILRALPMPEDPTTSNDVPPKSEKGNLSGPIHAVCLEMPDDEANEKHFSKLKSSGASILDVIPSVANATLESIIPLFNDMHIVSLISTPDLGLGKTADEEGLLAGAVPTAEAVIDGAAQITPQLMALGFATGRAVMPDHKGVYPPLDRMSVITYWWGLELCIPPPSMKNLANGNNITHTVMNLLSALSLINGGVAEILPFIRYISQFVDFEWSSIKAQDKGKGVVCAATWIMPAALVPRPWDFPDPPSLVKKGAKGATKTGSGVGHVVPGPTQGKDQNAVDNVTLPPVMLPTLVVSSPSQLEGERLQSK